MFSCGWIGKETHAVVACIYVEKNFNIINLSCWKLCAQQESMFPQVVFKFSPYCILKTLLQAGLPLLLRVSQGFLGNMGGGKLRLICAWVSTLIFWGRRKWSPLLQKMTVNLKQKQEKKIYCHAKFFCFHRCRTIGAIGEAWVWQLGEFGPPNYQIDICLPGLNIAPLSLLDKFYVSIKLI